MYVCQCVLRVIVCVCAYVCACLWLSPTWFMISGMTVYLYADAEGYSFFYQAVGG